MLQVHLSTATHHAGIHRLDLYVAPSAAVATATAPAAAMQVVSLHCNLDANTHHLINKERLTMMKDDAVLINAARGPCIDEAALVAHMQKHPNFRTGYQLLDGFRAY